MNNAVLEPVKSFQAIQNHFKGGNNFNEYRTVWSRINQNLLIPYCNNNNNNQFVQISFCFFF